MALYGALWRYTSYMALYGSCGALWLYGAPYRSFGTTVLQVLPRVVELGEHRGFGFKG
jgi:hypothetical protein